MGRAPATFPNADVKKVTRIHLSDYRLSFPIKFMFFSTLKTTFDGSKSHDAGFSLEASKPRENQELLNKAKW